MGEKKPSPKTLLTRDDGLTRGQINRSEQLFVHFSRGRNLRPTAQDTDSKVLVWDFSFGSTRLQEWRVGGGGHSSPYGDLAHVGLVRTDRLCL